MTDKQRRELRRIARNDDAQERVNMIEKLAINVVNYRDAQAVRLAVNGWATQSALTGAEHRGIVPMPERPAGYSPKSGRRPSGVA